MIKEIMNQIRAKMKLDKMYEIGNKYDFEVAVFNPSGDCLWFKGYSNLEEAINRALKIELSNYEKGSYIRIIYIPEDDEDFSEWICSRYEDGFHYNNFNYV